MELLNEPLTFISYSHRDADWAREFAETLRARGLRIWFDQFNVELGASISHSLEEALRDSGALVLVLDSESIRSPWFSFELGLALSTGKRVIAVVPEDLDLAQLPAALRSRRFLLKHSPRDTAEELVGEIAA